MLPLLGDLLHHMKSLLPHCVRLLATSGLKSKSWYSCYRVTSRCTEICDLYSTKKGSDLHPEFAFTLKTISTNMCLFSQPEQKRTRQFWKRKFTGGTPVIADSLMEQGEVAAKGSVWLRSKEPYMQWLLSHQYEANLWLTMLCWSSHRLGQQCQGFLNNGLGEPGTRVYETFRGLWK